MKYIFTQPSGSCQIQNTRLRHCIQMHVMSNSLSSPPVAQRFKNSIEINFIDLFDESISASAIRPCLTQNLELSR